MQRMEFQARSPATAVQLLLHAQDSAENACSVRTGYVFFGTLVIVCSSSRRDALPLFMPWWVEPRGIRESLRVSVCLSVCVFRALSLQWLKTKR